jgi:hypothetical protein
MTDFIDDFFDEEESDYNETENVDRFKRDYDDVFMPDGSLLVPMSVLDDESVDSDI